MKRKSGYIIIPFAVSFLAMVMLCYYAIKSFNQLNESSSDVERSYDVISRFDNLEGLLKDIDRYERGYLLTKDTMYLRLLNTRTDTINSFTDTLKYYITDNEDSRRNLIWIRTCIVNRLSSMKADIAYADTSKSGQLPKYFFEGRDATGECKKHLEKMKEDERAKLNNHTRHQTDYRKSTYDKIKYLFFVFGIITLILFVLMMRELFRRFRYQDELQERLIDLKRSHNELEQIAFASSHDLKEPLRKIQVFTNKIIWQKKIGDEETLDALMRINASALRMQELVEDLADLTSLVKIEGDKTEVSLNKVVQDVVEELAPKIKQKSSEIVIGELADIQAFPGQLHILFKALIDNAVKFSKEQGPSKIVISGEMADEAELGDMRKTHMDKKFYRVSVSDNGIGFENKFMDKMFFLFQRLHNQQAGYEGKGTGLAICQRVMANHKGYIIASGHPDAGATFKLYFPMS
ncbi:sensor histidine kinase [Chitinophagaceae bacterium MMS25-I14]